MVMFFPLSVTCAVPGGLGRLLLSSGCCCAMATVATASTRNETPTAKYFCRIFYIFLSRKPRYHHPGSFVKSIDPLRSGGGAIFKEHQSAVESVVPGASFHI